MTKTMAAFGMLVLMVLPVMVAAKDQKVQEPPVAVFVVQPAANGGFVDAALQDRIDSTKDLTNSLLNRNKTVQLVDSREAAAVVVEVLGRSVDEQSTRKLTRDILTGTFGSEAYKSKVVVVKLSVGDYSTDIIGITTENEYTMALMWTSATGHAATQIEKWIKTNRAKLPLSVN